jgi:VanZ family protein
MKIIEIMEKILKKLANIQHDKALHFMYGFIIFNLLTVHYSFIISLGIITFIAIIKEIYDYKIPGHEASIMDIIYGIAPGTIQTILNAVI